MVVLPTLSLSGETSPYKVELLCMHEIDGELLQVTSTFTLVRVLVNVCFLNLKQVLIMICMMMMVWWW